MLKLSKRARGRYQKVVDAIEQRSDLGDDVIAECREIATQYDLDYLFDEGTTLMSMALAARNEAAVALLLEWGAGPNRRALGARPHQLPLLAAAHAGLLRAAEALIDYGANVDLLTDDGLTVAEVAEQGEHPEHATTFARWMEEFTLKGIEL